MKSLKNKIAFFPLFFTIVSCGQITGNYVAKYKANSKKETIEKREINKYYFRNLSNIESGFPFYVVKQTSFLYIENPYNKQTSISYKKLSFGDVLYPVKKQSVTPPYLRVRTFSGEIGWICCYDGISLDYTGDTNLYYFSDGKDPSYGFDYYLNRYKKSNGTAEDSDKLILLKNIIPMLLGNFKTDGWFYPEDYETALNLANYAVSIAKDQDTFFYASTMFDDWRINEYVIAQNLLADCYHKLEQFEKAEEIHELLIKKYYWKRADNTQIGGLNSIVKLEKIYLDKLKKYEKESQDYRIIKKKIIDLILSIDSNLSYQTLMDKTWHLTVAEWTLDILRKSLEYEDFLSFCETLKKETDSKGFSDLINVYKAIAMYQSGKKEEAMQLLSSIKSNLYFMRYLRINDWLSEQQIIPDSVLYQYQF